MTQLTGIMPFAAATAKLIKNLQDWDDHEVIPYGSLTAVANKNVRSGEDGAGNLDTAIKNMRKTYGKVFRRVGNGIKLLTAAEIVEYASQRCKSHHKSARKTINISEMCDIGKLDATGQQRHIITQAKLRVIQWSGEKKAERQLESMLNGQQTLPDRGQLLDAFK